MADETLVLDGSVLDARAERGETPRRIGCRLVGVPRPEAEGDDRPYLTNLPGVVAPRQIADLIIAAAGIFQRLSAFYRRLAGHQNGS
jgi:hypothetical protein